MKIKFQKMLEADTGANGGSEMVENSTVVGEGENQDTKTFSQSELDSIITKRLEKAQKKWEKETQSKIETLKVSSMTAEQKQDYEKSKLDQQLSEKEEQLRVREMRLDAINILEQKNLPKELLDYLNYKDESSLEQSVNTFGKILNDMTQVEVKRRLGGYTPPEGSSSTKSTDSFIKGLRGSK